MKTKEELNALKNEVKTLNKKLAELSEEELKEVSGGLVPIPYLDIRPIAEVISSDQAAGIGQGQHQRKP